MTNLSPAAWAVLCAYRDFSWTPDEEDNSRYYRFSHKAGMAAALRSAADQVVPDEPAPTGMRPAGDVYSAREIRRGQRQETRSQLLAIAAELESQ